MLLFMQVDSAVVVLAEDAGGKSSESAKKVLNKKDSPSGKNVLQKVQMLLTNLEKKITDVNGNTRRYVSFSCLSFSKLTWSVIC